MEQAEYEELIKKAKEKYKADEQRRQLDKRNEYHRKWYAENAEYIRARNREWQADYRKKHREDANKKHREYNAKKIHTCERCGKTMQQKCRKKHDTYSKCGLEANGGAEAEYYTCPVCNKTMLMSAKSQHSKRTLCAEDKDALAKYNEEHSVRNVIYKEIPWKCELCGKETTMYNKHYHKFQSKCARLNRISNLTSDTESLGENKKIEPVSNT